MVHRLALTDSDNLCEIHRGRFVVPNGPNECMKATQKSHTSRNDDTYADVRTPPSRCDWDCCGCLFLQAAFSGALTLRVTNQVHALIAHMTIQLNCPPSTWLLVLNANRLVLNVGPTVLLKQPAI